MSLKLFGDSDYLHYRSLIIWLVSFVNKALITTISSKSVVLGILMSLVGSRSITGIGSIADSSHSHLLGPASG